MPRLSTADTAPDFTLPAADGGVVSLATLRAGAEKGVVVYFYPAAGTPGCTKEACDFRDNLAELNDAGVDVLGISPDKPAKLATFRDDEGLTFPLLSDTDLAVQHAYGTWGEKSLYGKTVTGSIRSTFIIDEQGRVAKPMYNVKATGHVARLRTELGLGD